MKILTPFHLLLLSTTMLPHWVFSPLDIKAATALKVSAAQVQIGPYDVIITELLPDPNPSVGLPAVEFVELYNRSDHSVDLGQLQFDNSGTARSIPNYLLAPDTYALIADHDDTTALNIYGPVLGIRSFSALANAGDDLSLINTDGVVVHSVSYDLTWYRDGSKKNGGYTLEMINIEDPCSGSENWRSSNSLIGGTPGAINSVYNTDLVGPFDLVSVVPAPDQVSIVFTKQVMEEAYREIRISPKVDFALVAGQLGTEIIVDVKQPLMPGIEYQIVLDDWVDCRGQMLETSEITFLLPEQPQMGDLLINEILFNPEVGGSDYVEIINQSAKFISLEGLFLSNLDKPADVEPLVSRRLMRPNDILVFSKDVDDIKRRYHVPKPDNLLRQDLPSLPDSEGNLTLYRTEGPDVVVLDAFDYSADFHLSLLKNEDGVSLERVSLSSSTNDASNWHSAAEAVGFGTPTEENSQSVASVNSDQFELSPRVFSPDGDGLADFLLLHYRFPDPGYITTIKIFDAAGRLAYDWIDQSSLGVSGSLKWDGTNEEGQKTPVGIYTVLLESFRESGNIIRWKETCVVANRLD